MSHRILHHSRNPRLLVLVLAIAFFAAIVYFTFRRAPANDVPLADIPAPIIVPDFSVPIGRIRQPLPHRIVSFHRGRADKNLIKLAAQLGFNGVQFQIEGSTERGVQEFARRDAREHLVDYCHQLGMKVTLWVHELSDLPPRWSENYLGEPTASNDRLFAFLSERYDRILSRTVPNVDGIVLTVVETQVRATDRALFKRLASLLAEKSRKHNKSLIVRTFVWYPEEFSNVMAAIGELPPETLIMSKVVPQDWQMRGAPAPEIGNVGGKPQIVEYDVAGEYFHNSTVANCMVELLKRQFDDGMAKNIQGICVRVDRFDASILFHPNEVNLWALGLMASGFTDNPEDIWAMWASYRYGKARRGGEDAWPLVVAALRGTSDVVTEITSVGPFTFGDTRKFPPLPDDEYIFATNWQNWHWDRSYLPAYYAAQRGDAAFIRQVVADKQAAMKIADENLARLEAARPLLPAVEYMILYTKLLTNRSQLAVQTPMMLAALHFRAMNNASSETEKRLSREAMQKEIDRVRTLAAALNGSAIEVEHLGRKWFLGVPEGLSRQDLGEWADEAESILRSMANDQ